MPPSPGKTPDTDFMLATLSYLRDDFDAAHAVIGGGINANDNSDSLKNPKQLLNEEVQNAARPADALENSKLNPETG